MWWRRKRTRRADQLVCIEFVEVVTAYLEGALSPPDASRLEAVFDWGCSLAGDFLYEVAWFTFWAPWYPALDAIDLPDWPAHSLPARAQRPPALTDERDVHLSVRIERGVITNLLLLNHLIEGFADRRLRKIDPFVRKILGIGLYQILFLDRVGAHAAEFARLRNGTSISTVDVLFGVIRVYDRDFDRALYVRATDRRELLDRLSAALPASLAG